MPAKKHKNNEAESFTTCHVAGCDAPASYKAPVSRERLRDYCWYCLDHIREHNKTWDFLAGYTPEQIEAFIKDATTGHRPTWTREQKAVASAEHLQDALHEFLHLTPRPKKPPVPPKVREALTTLGLEHPFTAPGLKAQYRRLVKQYHPDVNKGDKKSEEQFKKVTAAYRYLAAL